LSCAVCGAETRFEFNGKMLCMGHFREYMAWLDEKERLAPKTNAIELDYGKIFGCDA
jgi:hypothetical protein